MTQQTVTLKQLLNQLEALRIPFTAGVGGVGLAGGSGETTIIAPASLGEVQAVAGGAQLSFATDQARYADAIHRALAAGAVVLVPAPAENGEQESAPAEGGNPAPTEDSGLAGVAIAVPNPRAVFAQLVAEFFVAKPQPEIAATARIHPSVRVPASVSVGEYSVVRAGVVLGEGVMIRDHVVIGERVQIGAGSLIKSHAVIGEEGFGIEVDSEGNNIRIPHIGSAVLGENTEIGCFTTVCSGTLTPTRIGDHSKIDDHVHIAHNAQLASNVIVTACAEVSGSVRIADRVWLGPNSSIKEGLTVGEGALLGLGAVAVKSVPTGEIWVGNPAKPLPPRAN